MKRAVLAYSGGLDTTVAIPWLKSEKQVETIAVAVDVGQRSDMEAIRERALTSGAVEAVVIDAVDEMAEGFVAPALKANALYQQKYPLVSALSRPLICKHLARIAREYGAGYVAHGCTGKGNDQVRFEVSLAALAPEIEVLAPIREWGMSRASAIRYGLDAGLPLDVAPEKPYSIDENLWGRTIECGALEDPMAEAPDDIWERTADPATAPRGPEYLTIGFEEGVPVSIDGGRMPLAALIAEVERRCGAFGYGRVDMIEDRVVGIKSREVYEVPGALALITAHSDLEELTCEREVLRTKRILELRYAQAVYEGFWFSPLREALDAFNGSVQQDVTGEVRLKLTAGSVNVVGRSGKGSLYDMALATYEDDDAYDHRAGEGFTKVWGLPLKTWAARRKK